MTPACSSSRTRRQQGEGETPTEPARSTFEMRAFSCSTDRMRRSMASRDGFSGKAGSFLKLGEWGRTLPISAFCAKASPGFTFTSAIQYLIRHTIAYLSHHMKWEER